LATDFQQNNLLIAQIRDSYGRLVYTHKTHEKEADLLKQKDNRIKLFQIVLSVLTTGSILPLLVKENQTFSPVLPAILSAILSFLNIYVKNQNLAELTVQNKKAATDLWLLREKYLSLLCDLQMGSISIEEARKTRNELDEAIASIYSKVPITSSKAFGLAQKALKKDEEMTFSDSEIDQFLPTGLRKESKLLPNQVPNQVTGEASQRH
jgi:hypothetical protein